MFFGDVVNRGVMPALDKMLAFTQARQRMLAENVANVDNPHYRTKQLDARAFQNALREALDTLIFFEGNKFETSRLIATDITSQERIGVEVKGVSPLWQRLVDDLDGIYPERARFLYQPIEHPWFSGWLNSRARWMVRADR